ncbi:MAG: hypothetical protein ACRDKI_08810 [Solirubrobacterales bacterium]
MAVHLARRAERAGVAEGEADVPSLADLPVTAVREILAKPGRYEIVAEVREIS